MERAVEVAEEDAEDAPSARRKTDSDYTWKGYDPGEISKPWHADHEAHVLDMELTLPEGWTPEVVIPFELSGWKVYMNGKCHA